MRISSLVEEEMSLHSESFPAACLPVCRAYSVLPRQVEFGKKVKDAGFLDSEEFTFERLFNRAGQQSHLD